VGAIVAAIGASESTSARAADVVATPPAQRAMWIGVETDYLGTDPSATKQTFYGFTRTAMETQLSQATSAYDGSTAYAGLAVHDEAGYAALAP
jgi:hypothetical protein